MNRRCLGAIVILIMLPAGLAYSGVATFRLYRQIFQAPRATGPAVTIDAYVAPLQIESAAEIRAAVERAGWVSDADVSLVADVSSALSAQEIGQVHFAMSYLLYPRRIWLRSPSDALEAVSHRGTRHVLLIGHSNPFGRDTAHQVSSMLHLVNLP
jgi:hypothetical protein